MNEKALGVFEHYDIEVNGTFKIRGNYGCHTPMGTFMLYEYNNSNDRIAVIQALYNYLEKNGLNTDYVMMNKEGEYVSVSEDGYTYILKRWLDGDECDINNESHILAVIENLAKFHKCCENTKDLFEENKGFHPGKNIIQAFGRHNKEIVHIRNYIRKRKNKNYFEMSLHNIIEPYYEQAMEALELLKGSEYSNGYQEAVKNKTLNHGSYNYHNIMFYHNKIIMINMMKVNYSMQIQDVYDFLRKIMEKNSWDIKLADSILDCYSKYRSISDAEYGILKAMFEYPEKFWKIINYYYNSNKAWYSEKNEDKLKQFQKQESLRRNFLKNM